MASAAPTTTATASEGESQPARWALPKAPTEGGRPFSGLARVRISIAPEKRLALASVTTKLLTPDLEIAIPFSQPRSPPSPSANSPASDAGIAQTCIIQPAAMTTQTPIAPTERFMPPAASTTICEKPIRMSIASVRPRLNRLKLEMKPGDFAENSTQSAASTATKPACGPRPPSREGWRTGVVMGGGPSGQDAPREGPAGGARPGFHGVPVARPGAAAHLQVRYFCLNVAMMSAVSFFTSAL